MALTVSCSNGRVAILHDKRIEISTNVDPELVPRSEIYIDRLAPYGNDPVAYTDAEFQPCIEKFNQGKKPSRQIRETYTAHLNKENEKLLDAAEKNLKNGIKRSVRKPTKICHEYVLQFGNRETNSTLPMPGESTAEYATRMASNREGYRETVQEMQRRYPHAKILLATYHADEPNGTPHMHIIVQFVGEAYERGLERQISISKALELDGFSRSGNRGDYAINRWTKDIEDNILAPIMQRRFSQSREILGDSRPHEDIRFFRQKAAAEAAALEEKRTATQEIVRKAEEDAKKIVDQANATAADITLDAIRRATAYETAKKAEADKKAEKITSATLKASEGKIEALRAEVAALEEEKEAAKEELLEIRDEIVNEGADTMRGRAVKVLIEHWLPEPVSYQLQRAIDWMLRQRRNLQGKWPVPGANAPRHWPGQKQGRNSPSR